VIVCIVSYAIHGILVMHSCKIIMQEAQRVCSMQKICRFACAQKLAVQYRTEPIKCQLPQTDPRDALSCASCCTKTCKLAIVERRPRQVFNSIQILLISRQTVIDKIARTNKMNNERAKIVDICCLDVKADILH